MCLRVTKAISFSLFFLDRSTKFREPRGSAELLRSAEPHKKLFLSYQIAMNWMEIFYVDCKLVIKQKLTLLYC